MSFLAAFLARAASAPDRVAFTIYDAARPIALTNAELASGGWRWAQTLRDAGLRPRDVVLVALPLCPSLLEAFVGILLAGGVPSMMPVPSAKQDPQLFWSSHDRLFTRLGGGLLVTTPANAAAVEANITGVAMRVVTPADVVSDGLFAQSDRPCGQGSDIACLQHSSGTTGLKKGVALTFDAIDSQLEALAGVLALREGDTIVSWLPLYHDMGFVACLLQSLRSGVPAVLLDPFAWLLDPLSFLEAIARHAGTLAWMPNFAFAHLTNAAFDDSRRVDLASLRAIIDCSEACRPDTLSAFAGRFEGWGLRPSAVGTCYAMAETVFAITQSEGPGRVVQVERAALEAGRIVRSVIASEAKQPRGRERSDAEPGYPWVASPSARNDDLSASVSLISSGVPLPGVELAILDETGRNAPADRIGEIAVAAPFLFTGYHLEPDRTAAVFRDGFYRTGDLGFRLDDNLFVLGRRDDLLILLGRNVYAHEIESLLADVPGLKPGRSLALGLDDPEIGSQVLVVVAETLPGIDEAAVRAAIRLRLESILAITPKRIVLVESGWLVKSTSGKIARTENGRKLARLLSPVADSGDSSG